MSADTITRLNEWFAAHCDGDWEHDVGVRIESLDNPGWRVRIRLADTSLESVPFEVITDEYDHETRWLRCWRTEDMFEAACGVPRLGDSIDVFLDWAHAHEG